MTNLKTIYDNYEFDIDVVGAQINIKLTNTELLEFYDGTINEDEISIKPITKFFSMIKNALSRVPNFSVTIDSKTTQLVCCFNYSTEMIEIEESIIFIKVDAAKTKELLLIKRVKELTEIVTEHVTPVFGHRDFGEKMIFSIDSKILDFITFDDYTMYSNFKDYNKFKKVTKIIMSTNSKVFCNELTKYFMNETFACGCRVENTNLCAAAATAAAAATVAAAATAATHRIVFNTINHFNHPSVYLPSVTEVQVYCSPLEDYYPRFFESWFTKFGSLPNLEKLTLTLKDNTGFKTAFLDIHSMVSTSPNKKLKHIVFENIASWIKPEFIDKAKLFAQVNHINLEII